MNSMFPYSFFAWEQNHFLLPVDIVIDLASPLVKIEKEDVPAVKAGQCLVENEVNMVTFFERVERHNREGLQPLAFMLCIVHCLPIYPLMIYG